MSTPSSVPVGLATKVGLAAAVGQFAAAGAAAALDRTPEAIGALIGAGLALLTVLGGRYAQASASIKAAGNAAVARPVVADVSRATSSVLAKAGVAEMARDGVAGAGFGTAPTTAFTGVLDTTGDEELYTADAEARIAEADTVVPGREDEGDAIAAAELAGLVEEEVTAP